MAQIDVFDTTLQKSATWVRDIMQALDWKQEQRAYLALRAVLHTLRDRLPVAEAAHLGAQLPMLIRGLYYEGWTPSDKPLKMHRDEFLACIQDHFRNDAGIDPVRITRTVLEVMFAHMDVGELAKIAGLLPAEFADFWPVGAIS